MRHLTCALMAAAAAIAAAPAFAQDVVVDELVITGRLPGDTPSAISAPVSYADLDLTYGPDREVLRQRISTTARRLCDQLNEPSPSPANLGRSCQEAAIRDATDQLWAAVDDAYAQRAYAANDTYYPPR